MTIVMEIYFVCKCALYIYILAVKRMYDNTATVMNKGNVLNTEVKVKVLQQIEKKKTLVSGILSYKFYSANDLDKQKQNY